MSLAFDLRFAGRNLLRRPGLTCTVVGTLAIGVGLNTAMFSLVDAVLLHPLGVDHPSNLVALYEEQNGRPYGGMTLETYRALAGRASSVDGLASAWTTSIPLTDSGRRRDITLSFVSENYFAVLGVPAAVGRTMTSADPAGLGANPVVVLSDALWRTSFGGDPTVVGRTIHLRGRAFTIIGVAPARFRGIQLAVQPEAWAPTSMIPALGIDLMSIDGALNLEMPLYSLVGRLRAGASIERASAELDALVPGVTVLPLTDGATIQSRPALLRLLRLMLGVVALTLLLACVSVANLLVVRGRERARELGVRAALGASTARLAYQLFSESVLLALAGGAASVGVAFAALRALVAFTLPGRIALDHVSLGLNLRVLAFTCCASIATALGFGLAPAISPPVSTRWIC